MPIARTPAKAAPAAAPKVAPKAAPAKAATAPKAAVQTAASTPTTGEEHLTVTKTLLENGQIKGQPVVEETINIRQFATSTATCAYGMKMRRNLGNYEAVELSVFLSVPCYAEDIDNTQGQVVGKVEEIFNEQMSTLDVSAFQSEAEAGAADFGGDGTTAEEQVGEATEEGAAEEGTIDAEWIDSADRETLEQLCAENPDTGIDPADYPDDDDLRTMIKSAFGLDGEEGAAEEGAAEEAPGYTQEELEQSSMDDLKQVFAAWEMGAFPAYTAKNQAVVKKSAIKKILDRQNAAG